MTTLMRATIAAAPWCHVLQLPPGAHLLLLHRNSKRPSLGCDIGLLTPIRDEKGCQHPETCLARIESDDVQTYPSALGQEVGALLKKGLLGFSIEGPGEMGEIILDSDGSQITAPLELCAVAAVPLPEFETCYVKGTQPFRPKCDTRDEVEMLLLFTLPEAEKKWDLQCPNLKAWATSQRQVGK